MNISKHKETVKTIALALLIGALVGGYFGYHYAQSNANHTESRVQAALDQIKK